MSCRTTPMQIMAEKILAGKYQMQSACRERKKIDRPNGNLSLNGQLRIQRIIPDNKAAASVLLPSVRFSALRIAGTAN